MLLNLSVSPSLSLCPSCFPPFFFFLPSSELVISLQTKNVLFCLCRSWQTLAFEPQPVTFIRIVGTHNTANEVNPVVCLPASLPVCLPLSLSHCLCFGVFLQFLHLLF